MGQMTKRNPMKNLLMATLVTLASILFKIIINNNNLMNLKMKKKI